MQHTTQTHGAANEPMRPPRVLVVYYSRTGNTESVAIGLARVAGADLEAIQDLTPRTGLFGYLRANYRATLGYATEIRSARHDPRKYDLVLVGSPSWNSSLSCPVRAYLTQVAGALPEVAFFVTCDSRGAEQVVRQMSELAGKEPVAVLALTERDLKGRFAIYISEYWETLMKSWDSHLAPAAPPPPEA